MLGMLSVQTNSLLEGRFIRFVIRRLMQLPQLLQLPKEVLIMLVSGMWKYCGLEYDVDWLDSHRQCSWLGSKNFDPVLEALTCSALPLVLHCVNRYHTGHWPQKKMGGDLGGEWVRREVGAELGDCVRKLSGTGGKGRMVKKNVTWSGTSLWRKR